jgi:hypothetical protein
MSIVSEIVPTEALKFLGFGTPFFYASATYGVFHYLDRKASAKAKQAISAWFKPLEYDKATVAAVLVELLDRLYTKPLFGWRAMLRSFCASLALLIIFFYEFYSGPINVERVLVPFLLLLISNATSDYLSLFVIRRWLAKAGKRPPFAILTGLLIGVMIIIAVQVCVLFIAWLTFEPQFIIDDFTAAASSDGFTLSTDGSDAVTLLSQFAVLLWLPLLGVAILFLQIVNSLLWSVAKMQWFLKQGHLHPLDAIGYVASAIVFFGYYRDSRYEWNNRNLLDKSVNLSYPHKEDVNRESDRGTLHIYARCCAGGSTSILIRGNGVCQPPCSHSDSYRLLNDGFSIR